ncbi:MAG: ACT domain-containing protein [Fusobacteriaceae bacterium]|jgi:hypothetical protein|nr:ACT domain-containing protein [Fusobacteriaceae bacterium]
MILKLLEDEYSVYKVSNQEFFTKNIFSTKFISITKTEDEVSIVASSNFFKDFDKFEDGWKILKIEGILDFNLIGILSKISNILANEKIAIFVISTYNTDYIMIKKENIEKAITILTENKYQIEIGS